MVLRIFEGMEIIKSANNTGSHFDNDLINIIIILQSDLASASTFDAGAFKFIEKKVLQFEKCKLSIFSTCSLFKVLNLFAAIDQVLQQLTSLNLRLTAVEKLASSASKPVHEIDVKKQPAVEKKKPVDDDDDDDVDLFGSDSEEESAEAAQIREDRLKAYAAKKSKSNYLFQY